MYPLDIYLKVSSLGIKGAVLSEITIDKDLIILKGETQALSDVEAVKRTLEAPFDQVRITDTKKSAGDKNSFTITMKEKKSL